MQSRTGCTCLIFLKCAFSNAPPQMSTWFDAKPHWLHLFYLSSLCVFKGLLKLSAWIDAKSHWSHLFDFLNCAFSNATSNCQLELMQSRTCMIFKIVRLKYLLKLLAWIDAKWHCSHLFDFSPFFIFKMPPQIVSLDRCKVALVAFVDFSPLCIFKCLLKSPVQEEA